MIKLFGAIIVIFSSTSIGLSKSQVLKKRTEELRELRLAVRRIESEITFNQIALSDILLKTSINMSYSLRKVFVSMANRVKERRGKPFSEILGEELKSSNTHLKQEDIKQIIHLLESLGCTDIENQIKTLKMAAESLEHLEIEAEKHSEKCGKLYLTLGICAGLSMTILMM